LAGAARSGIAAAAATPAAAARRAVLDGIRRRRVRRLQAATSALGLAAAAALVGYGLADGGVGSPPVHVTATAARPDATCVMVWTGHGPPACAGAYGATGATGTPGVVFGASPTTAGPHGSAASASGVAGPGGAASGTEPGAGSTVLTVGQTAVVTLPAGHVWSRPTVVVDGQAGGQPATGNTTVPVHLRGSGRSAGRSGDRSAGRSGGRTVTVVADAPGTATIAISGSCPARRSACQPQHWSDRIVVAPAAG
ncbi:MAG TPA: hypothetical protein VHB02_03235, partial [Acidimicrobiales bacterium]|nr:hypothetical protein [Acidimicrobiales bacterium]